MYALRGLVGKSRGKKMRVRRTLCFILVVVCAVCIRPEDSSSEPDRPGPQEHPFIFTTRARLQRLLKDDRPIPADGRRYLEVRIRVELAEKNKYLSTYNGCRISTYLQEFTYEQGSATKAMADLALYAYLHKLDSTFGSDAL